MDVLLVILHCFEEEGRFLVEFPAVVQEEGHWQYCSRSRHRLALDSWSVAYCYCFASVLFLVAAVVVTAEEKATQEVMMVVAVASATREEVV